MTRSRLFAAATLLFAATACTGDAGSPLAPDGDPVATISDAAHSGTVPGFYFLPPMVPNPAYSGTFDPALQPRVEICEMAGPTCGPVIAQYTTTSGTGGQLVTVGSSSYQVNWHTNQFNLNPAKTYRISVYVGTFRLGFADVDVVNSGNELKNVDTQEYIPLKDGRTLPIKFRIETGIAGAVTISPDSASIFPGQTQQFTATVTDLHGNPIPGAPVTWSSSNPAVATIDANGLATGVAPGTTTITATSGGASDTAILVVANPNTPPVANPDTFQAIGNVSVPVAAPGVLANDTDNEGNTLSVVPGTFPTTAGGTVTLNADGSFTYLSAAGFTGTDSFQYTVTDGTDSATATVTMVSPYRVWYVDNTAAAPGDGRDASPFATLAAAEAASSPNETIFVRTGDGTTAGMDAGITLKPGQTLTGQGVSSNVTVTLNGQTVTLLTAGAAPQIGNVGAGATIRLAQNNTVQGIAVSSSAGAGVAGVAFGTLAVARVSVAANGGPAVDLQDGTAAAAFLSLSSSGSTGAGIRLVNVSGSVSAPAGTIANAAGAGVLIQGGDAAVAIDSDVSGSGGGAAVVTLRTGGSVALGGSISDSGQGIRVEDNSGGSIAFTGASKVISTGTSDGVTVRDNTGAQVTFAGGGLQITTTTGRGFVAAGGGTLTVTGAGNEISSAGGVAFTDSMTAFGPSGASFRSISANGGAHGILLVGTSGGGLQVTGAGGSCTVASPACTGGTIQNTTGAGVSLNGVNRLRLVRVQVRETGSHGIAGTATAGLTLESSLIRGAGDANDEAAIFFATAGAANLTGVDSIIGTVVDAPADLGVVIHNYGGSLQLVVVGSTFANTQSGTPGVVTGDDLFRLIADRTAGGAATITARVAGSTFDRSEGDALFAVAQNSGGPVGGGTLNLTVDGNTFTGDNNANDKGIAVQGTQGGTVRFDLGGNVITNQRNEAIAVRGDNTASVQGAVHDNTIGSAAALSGSRTAQGVFVNSDDNADVVVRVENNTIRNTFWQAIWANAADGGGGAPKLDATIIGNTAATPLDNGGTYLPTIDMQGTTAAQVCGRVEANAAQPGEGFAGSVEMLQADAAVFAIHGLPAPTSDASAFLQAQNPASVPPVYAFAVTTFVTGSCRTPAATPTP